MIINYNIRAEFRDNDFWDFQVPSEDLKDAQKIAERKICEQKGLNPTLSKFDWRGQVVFVNRR